MHGDHLRYGGIDLGLVADVAMQVGGAQRFGQCTPPGVVDVEQGQVRALLVQAPRAGLADALGSASDNGDATLQPVRNLFAHAVMLTARAWDQRMRP